MILVSTACEKYLETDSPSAFTDLYIFSSEGDTRKALNSVYQSFANSSYDQRLSTFFSCNTDLENGHVHAGTDNTRRDLWSYRATSTNTEILDTWNNCYLGINRANEVIEGIRNSNLYKENNRQVIHMLGEAMAIRAYKYFLLQFYWGDVPFTTTPTKAGDEFYLPRTDRDTILAHMISDLIGIEPEMFWADQLPEGIERISRDFVIGMIARLSLYRGGYALRQDGTMRRADDWRDYYTLANTYAKKLIDMKQRTLDPDFQQMFMNQCQYITTTNMDVIWEVPYLLGVNSDIGWDLGLKVDGGNHDWGTGNNFINFPPNYLYTFDTTDTRLPVSNAFYYYDEDLVQQPVNWVIFISTHKWSRTWVPNPLGETSAKGTGINFPVLRYADVLLMLAESENELEGPNATAQEALKEVRQRAFPSEYWPEKVDAYISEKSGSREEFFEAIVDERAWEFGGECIRKFDLVRWNLLGEKIVEAQTTLKQYAEDSQIDDGPTSHLADELYYRRKSDGTLEFYNRFARRPDVVPPLKDVPNIGDNPDGYETVGWLSGLWDEGTALPVDYMDIQWSGYTDPTGQAPVPYILPIHQSIINSSRGVLDNNGYLLTF